MPAISIVWTQTSEPPASVLQERMLNAQSIYGVQSFSWSGDQISLGGCLSNILPEDRFDKQPLWNSDHSACLTADVRLDNRQDLVRVLDLVHPEELSDSSILMAAWERWGTSCLDHIVGAFAFAVWMPGRQELFAARDHAGERPLFYHRSEQFFALASMPKGILALPGFSRSFEESRIADWLACVTPDRKMSFFEGIGRVPPGHVLRVTSISLECKKYWHPADAKPTRYARDEDYADALRELLSQATECRLRTTKRVGSMLSAGLDSSSVTGSAARLLAVQGKRMSAFTAVPRPDFVQVGEMWQLVSEGAAAAEVARMYPNIDHFLVDSKGSDLLDTMKSWTNAMDEPALNVVNILWVTAILKKAQESGINVMLEGAMGNCTISWDPATILRHFFRRGRWIKLVKTAYGLRSHHQIGVRSAFRSALGGFLPAWADTMLLAKSRIQEVYAPIANQALIERYDLRSKILRYAFSEATDPDTEQSDYFELFDFGSIHAAAQAVTGVEMRDPTADKRVYEFCFSIPREQYVVGGHSRSLIRRAMKGVLPETTLSRYSRGYQGADWHLTMAESLADLRKEASLIEESFAARQMIDMPQMVKLLDEWPEGGYEATEVFLLWHLSLTRAISMGDFLRTHEHFPTFEGRSFPR